MSQLPDARQSDFLIGWVCILQAEYSAALHVLDKSYGTDEDAGFISGKDDPNKYRLGRIGPHYVVINRPRHGWSGQLPASKIVNGMKSTFPGMRFWLLVGIGGGVPSQKADVRLGDVVLGMSVLPYKKGKEKDNIFEITGKTKEPPVELLDVVTELKHKLEFGLSLDQMLDNVLQRQVASQDVLRRKYRRPSNDHLWRSDYIHRDDECASGNRDLTGCISIRGISDYSDGHKNDIWHDYAALSAAVCAAELLQCLSTNTVLKMRIEVTLDDIKGLIDSAVDGVEARINGSLNAVDDKIKHLGAANVKIQESIGFLNHFADEQKKFNESEMKDMRVACQQKLDESIRSLQRQAKNEAAKADYLTRSEWEKFTKQIENTAEKSSKLATAEEVLETAADLADRITEDVKGKRVGSVSSYFRFGSMFTGHARNFRGIGKKTKEASDAKTVAFSPSPIIFDTPISSQSDHTDFSSTCDGLSSQCLPSDTTGTSVSSNGSGLVTPAQPPTTPARRGYEPPSAGSSSDPSGQLADILNHSLQVRSPRKQPRSTSPLHQDSVRQKPAVPPKRFQIN
ncbi:hypothetical protein FPRO05_13471 [Fusarium proliferatum]|uniref:Nucleoside phosphorylase domain-containing protein n=1 Tax=Gibberella intermedia TaxID=948311 RepID=A0A365N1K5_GIBIN|nr:hypothetical protein FPRO05_13471 [Fusarium proliferatum]